MTLQCHMQSCVPLLVLGIDAAASVHQQRHQPHVGLLHSQVQRGLELTVANIHVTMALGGGGGTGSVQGPWWALTPRSPGPPRTLRPHLSDENLGHLPVVVQGGQVQRCEPILLLGVHQLPGPHQNPSDGSAGAGRRVWGQGRPQSGPAAPQDLAAGYASTPNSQCVAFEGRMVQQGEALAVRGSDVDARHLGEDLHDAAGASARRDGTVQGRVSMGVLPVVGQ